MGKIEKMNSLTDWERELALLENKSNLRKLPVIRHLGKEVEVNGKVMLNLSSNDYLGLAAYLPLRTEFLQSLTPDTFLPSSSSSRLLTGNFNIYVQIEDLLARLFRKESALVFNSGYHMNAGILPAVSDARTLILADKLVHASIPTACASSTYSNTLSYCCFKVTKRRRSASSPSILKILSVTIIILSYPA